MGLIHFTSRLGQFDFPNPLFQTIELFSQENELVWIEAFGRGYDFVNRHTTTPFQALVRLSSGKKEPVYGFGFFREPSPPLGLLDIESSETMSKGSMIDQE